MLSDPDDDGSNGLQLTYVTLTSGIMVSVPIDQVCKWPLVKQHLI